MTSAAPCILVAGRETRHFVEVDHRRGALAGEAEHAPPALAAAHVQLGDLPDASAPLLDRDVLDVRDRAALLEGDRPLEEFADREGLRRARLEAPQVDDPGADDLAGVDRRHPRERHEHASPPGNLDDEPHGGGRPGSAHEEDDVAHPADRVAERVRAA